ncbi:MAG: aldehyde dehydrogenase [Xanthomonadales bacterium]|nr:aldehyde dehydrogenase [Xanthomonadales bacterium]MCE7929923.1 aldehyde dehydrogenase [Xanthomonadales bacterium PRO6]
MRESGLRLANFIDGDYRAPLSGAWLAVHEPATGQVYAEVPDSGSADIEAAVAAAQRAQRGWSATAPSARAALLRRIADLLEGQLDAFAEEESRDSGKPVHVARAVDIPRAVANFRFFAAMAESFTSESHHGEAGTLNYTLRQPIGSVGCISPWNLPLYLFSWKIAPALAAGNCVIAKPSEVTPVSAWLLGGILQQACLPPGVLNIVHGSGARCGAPLVAHPKIKAVSFTGSTATGAAIAAATASQFKKLSLEMGGKNATVVFADCDFERALAESVRATFSNQGQICLCGSRVLVERSLLPRFREAFVERVRALRVGDPRDPGSDIGALVSAAHRDKVESYIALAHEEGGRLLTGGGRVAPEGRCAQGWFLQPTVFDHLDAHCRVNQEEIFGPVATLTPFDDEAQALAYANSTNYGLACSLWTRDLERAHRFAAALESGIVWVNCWMARDLRTPFGGVKHSGLGREGGQEAMRFFTEARNVAIRVN